MEMVPYIMALAVVLTAAFRQVEAWETWRSFRPATRGAFYLWMSYLAFHAIGRGWLNEISRPAPECPWALVLATIAVILAIGLLAADGIFLYRRAQKRARSRKIVVGLDVRD